MKSISRSILIIAATVAIAGIGTVGSAELPSTETFSPGEALWKTLAASGTVEARTTVDDEAPWGRIVRGDELEPRTLVRTGRRGRATLAQYASVLMVDPRSELELPSSISVDEPVSVIQDSGSVVYEVDGEKTDDFQVRTPYLIAGVKGTTFLVSVNDRSASVTVEHGTVEVTSLLTGKRVDVHAGETVLVKADDESEMRAVTYDRQRRVADGALDRSTLSYVRDQIRRLDKIVDDSNTAVTVQSTELPASGERDLLDRVGNGDTLAGTTDSGQSESMTEPVSEMSQDQIYTETQRLTQDPNN
jgi:hypothetical protein